MYRKSKNDSKRNIHDGNSSQQILSSQSKRARTSSHRKINQMSNKIFINKHMQIDNTHQHNENSEKDSNKSLHIRQSSYSGNQDLEWSQNHVNLQYHHKLADPLKSKCRDGSNRSMSSSKLKSKKKAKFGSIKISDIKLSNYSNITDTSGVNSSLSGASNTKSRKTNIEMKMRINQMIDQTCNFHKK